MRNLPTLCCLHASPHHSVYAQLRSAGKSPAKQFWSNCATHLDFAQMTGVLEVQVPPSIHVGWLCFGSVFTAGILTFKVATT